MLRWLIHNKRIKQARKVRSTALERLQAARKRGDTRSIGSARKALQKATHELMRLENG